MRKESYKSSFVHYKTVGSSLGRIPARDPTYVSPKGVMEVAASGKGIYFGLLIDRFHTFQIAGGGCG